MAKKVIILGTLDTKGQEFQYIKELIESLGVQTIVIDVGIKGKAYFSPHISSEEVARAAGSELAELIRADDRGAAIDAMMKGAAIVVTKLWHEEQIAGIISLGGSAGTTIGTAAMQVLPVGLPKLMVSTVASGDTRPYVGEKDITMMYSVVDVAGLNGLSRRIMANAAFAIAGMAKGEVPQASEDKPLIGATMFGVTTPCVTAAREYLEAKGYEVLVFHATGSGGKAMESLIESGYIKGVLDATTTEWADELVGGVLTAGPHRLEAAARMGIPQVVSVGALDMVNFGPANTVPEQFKDRNLYHHNATITLMRTTTEECRQLGEILADKINRTTGRAAVFLPLKGVSLIDVAGKPFYGPEEDQALFMAIRSRLNRDKIELVEMNTDINDEHFAVAMADKLIQLMENKS